jgi:hypothetical protein
MIRINGHLGAMMLSAFPPLESHLRGAETVLTGCLDRSALYGVLAEIEALGLDLLEIRQLEPPEEGAGRLLFRRRGRRCDVRVGGAPSRGRPVTVTVPGRGMTGRVGGPPMSDSIGITGGRLVTGRAWTGGPGCRP